MSNPILNDKAFDKAAHEVGWGAPDPSTRATPIDDGPISPWTAKVMTVNGSLTATLVLLVLLVGAAAYGWSITPSDIGTGIPGAAMIGVFVGLGCVFALMFKPMLAKFLAPVYALAEGVFVGAISKFYEVRFDGIVVQAIGATIGVALVMLVLYRTRIIRVTERFRMVVIAATMGLMVFYLFSWILSLFGTDIGIFSSSSAFGILFSVFAAGLAAFNLALDFDFIEKGAERQMPKEMEWVAAFGLLVTLVWLYLEMLRLLAKLQNR